MTNTRTAQDAIAEIAAANGWADVTSERRGFGWAVAYVRDNSEIWIAYGAKGIVTNGQRGRVGDLFGADAENVYRGVSKRKTVLAWLSE